MSEPFRESPIVTSPHTCRNRIQILKPYIAFIWEFLELLFFSGIQYGWHQLLVVFKAMGVLNPAPWFATDEQIFELIFQLGCAAMAIASLLLGFVLDMLGHRTYKLCGFFLFTTGCISIAFVSGSGSQQAKSPLSNASILASPLSSSPITTPGGVQAPAVNYNPIYDMLLLIYGVPAIAVASTVLLVANFSVGDYFPNWRFIIISFYSGKLFLLED